MPDGEEEKQADDLEPTKDAVDKTAAAEADPAPVTVYAGDVALKTSGTVQLGDQPGDSVVVPAIPAPALFSDQPIPPHIVGKGFVDAKGTWRVILPSGRVVALNTEYHGVTEHEDGSISVDRLVEFGPFTGKLTRGVWRVDHPEA